MRDTFRKTGSCSGSGSDELLLERILGVSKKTSHEKEELGGGNSIKGECLGLELGSMSLNSENIARVVPGRIMDLRFLPCSNATMIVVGNNFGNVGFWDVDSEDDDRLYLYHPHASTVSGISMHQHYFEKVINLVSKIGCIILTCFTIVGMSNSSKKYEPRAHLFAFGT